MLLLFVLLVFALNCISVFHGFTHVDEADIAFDIFKIYKNLAVDRNLAFAVWPDTGMNGPLHYYIYTILLFPLTYVLRIPVDVALRIVPLCTLPVTALFLFRTFQRLYNSAAALFSTMLFTSSVYYTFYVTLSLGEVWYTMFLAISFYYMIRADTRRDVYLSLIFFALPLMIKYTFITLLPMYVILLIMNWGTLKPRVLDFLSWALIVVAGFSPLLLSLSLGGTGFLSRFSQISMYTGLGLGRKVLYLFYYLIFGLGPIAFFLLVRGVAARRNAYRKQDLFFMVSFCAVLITVFASGAITFRYVYPLMFPFFFLVGLGVRRLEKYKLSRIMYPLILLSLSFSFYTQILNNYEPDWVNNIERGTSIYKRAGIYAVRNSGEEDIIALRNPTSFYVFGKRPMILNPLYETFEREDGTFHFQYRMSGLFEYTINERIKYFIITDDELHHHRIPQEFLSMLSLEKKFGSVNVFRNSLYKETGKPVSSEKLRYDLRTIVQDYSKEGLLAPQNIREQK